MEIWDTPGGRRWAAPIRTAIARGTCIIVCHPDENTPLGLIERVGLWCAESRPVLHRLAIDEGLVTQDRVGNVELLARAVADSLGLGFAPGARIGAADIATSEGTDGAVLHIDARRASDGVAATWCAFAAAVSDGTRDIPASDRAAVIVHIAGGTAAVPESNTNLRAVWWWGALTALDVTILIDEAGRSPLDTATIVEVSRWDVALAERLAARWDGDSESLAAHVVLRQVDVTAGEEAGEPFTGMAGSTPGPQRSGWSAGLVEAWAGRLDPHPSSISGAEMSNRLWRAQLRTVYPWLEELRAELATTAAGLAANAHLPSAVVEELQACELGPLRHLACFKYRLPVPRPLRDVLDRAITARNSLAHLNAVDRVTLESLGSSAQAAGWSPGPSR